MVGWVKQFERLFPGFDHSISYFTGEAGKPRWISKVGLRGRYVLTAEMEVELNQDRTTIVKHSEPRFHLIEVAKITEDPNTGQILVENGDTEAEFGMDEWEKLVKKSGDLGVLGITLVKDKPVPLFDKHWKKAG
jgi:hypothetical protein